MNRFEFVIFLTGIMFSVYGGATVSQGIWDEGFDRQDKVTRELDSELQDLKKEHRKLTEKYGKRDGDFEEKWQESKQKLGHLKGATKRRWADLKLEMKDAYSDLQEEVREYRTKLAE